MRPRSVQGIIYNLGEIARCQLHLEDGHEPCPEVTKGDTGVPLIAVRHGQTDKALASATYLGEVFSIPSPGAGDDRSGQVFELVTQLLALNKSAKDLPAPSIITVTR